MTKEFVDDATGDGFSQFTDLTEAGLDIAGLFVEGYDDEKYYLNQDFSEPSTYTYYAKSAAKGANGYIKWTVSLDPEAEFTSLGEFAQKVGTATKVVSLIDSAAKYGKENKELKEYINASNIGAKSAALKQADQLYQDQMAYTLMTDALIPFVIAACGPVSTGTALLLAGSKALVDRWADRFWEQRAAGIVGDSYINKIVEHSDIINYRFNYVDQNHPTTEHYSGSVFGTYTHGVTVSLSGTGPFYCWKWDDDDNEYNTFIRELEFQGKVDSTRGYWDSRRGFDGKFLLEKVTFSDEQEVISKNSFDNTVKLESIRLPRNLKVIEEAAFMNSGLKNLECNVSMTTIEKNAFKNCTNLSSVKTNKNLKTIGETAFEGDYNIKSLELSEGLESIGEKAFYNCSRISGTIVIPESVTEIGTKAFANCKSIEKIIIKGNIDTIPKEAFYGCTNLKEIQILGDVRKIEDSAFDGAYKVEKVYLPGTIEELGSRVVGGWKSSPTMHLYYSGTRESFEKLNQYNVSYGYPIGFYTITHFEYNNETGTEKTDYSGKCGKNLTWELIVEKSPDEKGDNGQYRVIISGSGAMDDYDDYANTPWAKKIIEIRKNKNSNYPWYYTVYQTYHLELHGDITKIGANAFHNPYFVDDLILPNTLKEIGENAFVGINADYIYIPDSVTKIGAGAFEEANGYSNSSDCVKVHLGKGITEIPDKCFNNAKLYGFSKIPDNVKKIGEQAFRLYKSSQNVELDLPASIEVIGDYAFENVAISDFAPLKNAVSIGQSAFYKATVRKGDLYLSNRLTDLGADAFRECSGLTSLKFESNLETIPFSVFADNSEMSGDLVIPDSVVEIENAAFKGCSSLKSLKLSKNLKTIGSSAFEGCSNLRGNLVLPDGLERIGESAFSKCSGLTGDILIPYTVQYIERYAFYNCSGFNGKLDFDLDRRANWNEPHMKDGAFCGCSGLTGTVPVLNDIYARTYWGCDNIKEFVFALDGRTWTKKGERGTAYVEGVSGEYDLDALPRNAKVYCDTKSSSWVARYLTEAGYEYIVKDNAFNYHITRVYDRDIELDLQSSPTYRNSMYEPNFVEPKGVEIKIADPSIATVKHIDEDDLFPDDKSQYLFTAKKKGTTTYTITGPYGLSATGTITVTGTGPSTPVKTYSIEFLNNGHGAAVQKCTAASEIPYDLPQLSEEGYTFGGWYTAMSKDKNGNPVFSENNKATAGTALTANTKLYAKWTANTYTVTFDAGNGKLADGTLTTRMVTFGQPYGDLPSAKSDNEDEILSGWYTATIEGELVKKDDLVTTASDHTLYAMYKGVEKLKDPYVTDADGNRYESGAVLDKDTKLYLRSDNHNDAIYFVKGKAVTEIPEDDEHLYKSAIELKENTTISVKAVKEYFKSSKIATFTYTVKDSKTDFGEVLTEDQKAFNGDADKIPTGLWAAGYDKEPYYTGSAITFDNTLHVYYGKKLLTLGNDYTVKYANNVKAGVPNKKNPNELSKATITITGKGNYSGTKKIEFTVKPLELAGKDGNSENLKIADVQAIYTGKKIQSTTTVTYMVNGKETVLKKGTDFTYDYSGVGVEPGEYVVKVVGKGNYTGTATFTETVYGKEEKTNVSKLTFKAIPAQTADGTVKEPRPVITDKVSAPEYKKNPYTLTEDDYGIEYFNNKAAGTATAVITGKGKYAGTKTVTFKINGLALSKAKFAIGAVTYNGTAQTPSYTLTYQANKKVAAETLYEGKDKDYTVVVSNNIKKGNGTITFTGVGKYTGTVKKTFKINGLPMNGGAVTVTCGDKSSSATSADLGTFIYTKGGVKPDLKLTFNGEEMVLNRDYKVKYANNNAVGGTGKKAPTLTITGAGNYMGTLTRTFAITGASLADTTVTVTDIVANGKAGTCKPTITVYDTNGVKLAAGKDYDSKNIVYTYVSDANIQRKQGKKFESYKASSGEKVDVKNDIIPAGTDIKVTIYGKGLYDANTSNEAVFTYVNSLISKATVKLNKSSYDYTGNRIELSENDLKITVGKETLPQGAYRITSITQNTQKGTAKLTVTGVGKYGDKYYGGSKTVTFKINARKIN